MCVSGYANSTQMRRGEAGRSGLRGGNYTDHRCCGKWEQNKTRSLVLPSGAAVRQATCRVTARSGLFKGRAGGADGGPARSLLPAEAFDVCAFKELSKLNMCWLMLWRVSALVCVCVRENASESVQDGLREAERRSTAPL